MKTKFYISIVILITALVWFILYRQNIYINYSIDWKYIDKVAMVVFWLFLIYFLVKIIDMIFLNAFSKIIKNDSLAKKLLPLIHNVINISIWILWLLLLVNFLWYNITTFVTWAWIWWVIFALAWKEMASNLFWSISLVFSKSFKIWDLIRIKWLEWTVDEINLSFTKLIDKKGNYIYIPNKNIISENLENLSHWKFKKTELQMLFNKDIESNSLKKSIIEVSKLWEKLIKNKEIITYKINFDSINNDNQIFVFSYETEFKSEQVELKRNIYLQIKKITESI